MSLLPDEISKNRIPGKCMGASLLSMISGSQNPPRSKEQMSGKAMKVKNENQTISQVSGLRSQVSGLRSR